MSLLGNMKSEGLEKQEDRVGGFSLKKTGLYPAKVKLAYVTKADSGAMAMNLIFDIEGSEYRENAIYFTNKAGENFYFTKDANGNRTDKKAQLPGFAQINALCVLATGKEMHEQEDEEKIIKVWDSKEGKEVNKSLPVITSLIGAEILLAIEERTVNKTQKNDATGDYEPISADETRDENVILHFFHLDTKANYDEMKKALEAEEAGKPITAFIFADTWLEKFEGKKADRRELKDGAAAPKSGRPSGSGSAPTGGKAATSSLFSKK